MSRFARTLLLAAVVFSLVAASASAAPTNRLERTLGDLWTTVLETPTPQNPFGISVDPADACFDLGRRQDNGRHDDGGTVAPFGPKGAESCTVERGTKIFAPAWTTECSTFTGDTCGGINEAELRANARAADAGITTHTVAVDGRDMRVTEVETRLLRIHLPADNVFGAEGADRNGLSVAHGWVVLLAPMARGTHTIVIHAAGTYFGTPFDSTITTTIIVK